MTTQDIPESATLHSWYCPALTAYRFPGETLPKCWQHFLTQFVWVPLYTFESASVPEGWTLRSYYVPAEKSFYASHRTISEKTIKHAVLQGLYAPPGADGNEDAGHVPPQKKHGQPAP